MINEKVIYAVIIVVILLSGGTIYFHKAENWSYVDSFYFSVVSLTTVGYGDLTPTTPASRIVASFYIIFGLGIMLYLLSSVVGKYVFSKEMKVL